jgi:hypothetical protein
MTDAAANTSVARALAGVAAFAALLAGLAGGPLVYLQTAGVLDRATIVDTQERFELLDGGSWQHVFEITYRYRPEGAVTDMTVADGVDPNTFAHLRTGESVPIRYNSVALLRSIHGYGSMIEGASVWTRFFPATDDVSTTDLLLIGLTVALAVVAYRTNQSWLVAVAAAAVSTVCSAVVIMGPFALALLFGAWRGTRRAALGWGLLAALFLIPQLLWARSPHPPAPPAGSLRQAAGRARDVLTVRAVWPGDHRSGQHLPQPFDIADVVFVPPGSAEEVHVVDRVDSGSVTLRRGDVVPVVYPAGAPARGRLAGGARTYDRRLFTSLIEITYGGAAIIALVIAPAWLLLTRWFRRLPVVRRVADGRQQTADLAGLRDDDPRRAAILSRFRERGVRIPDEASPGARGAEGGPQA